jgi:hypothetical protein
MRRILKKNWDKVINAIMKRKSWWIAQAFLRGVGGIAIPE